LGKDRVPTEDIVFNGTGREDKGFSESDTETIPTRYSSQQIHRDDSISTVKNKILREVGFEFSYHELYLFSHITKEYDLKTIFENLAGKNDYLKRVEFTQLVTNLGLMSVDWDSDRDRFFLDDLYGFESEFEKGSVFYKISIGKQFRGLHHELFSADPYDIRRGTKIVQTSTNPLESFENQLLLNNHRGMFEENRIYACFAEDVMEYGEEVGLDGEETVSLYFPLLKQRGVTDTESLTKMRGTLLTETKKRASKYVFNLYDSVDMFHDMYRHRTEDMEYMEKGVEVVSFFIHPKSKHVLPLDIIFKNVHATKSVPFIKYNPGSRRENIYRFYCESITKYGTKIPFLPARTILKLAKETGKNKQISFSVESLTGDFYIDILNNGDIHIAGNNFKKALSVEELNAGVREVVNPVISHMNDFLKKNGYELSPFENMKNPGIEIEYLRFIYRIKIAKKIDLKKYRNSLQAIFEFTDEFPPLENGTTLRFKRVENYNEMDEEDIYIAGLFGQNRHREDIVGAFSRKYDLSLQEAALRIAKFLSEHQQQQGRFVKTSVRIAESPGFLVNMQIKPYDDVFICEFDLDNSITEVYLEYAESFFVYMDGILRMTQKPETTGFKVERLEKVKEVKKKSDKFDNVVTGINAVGVAAGIMVTDAFEEDDLELDVDLDMGPQSSFGNLGEFESVDIGPELDDLNEYENEMFDSTEPPVEPTVEPPVDMDLSSFDNLTNDIEEDSASSLSDKDSEPLANPAEEPSASPSSPSNNLMFDIDYDEEDESETDGGAGENLDKQLDGMELKDRNNNMFLGKLKKLEPTLFLSEDDGKYSAYSTLCQSSRSRQPVILTPEEKKRIDDADTKNNTTSYSHALEYGTDPDNKNYYICPRYWCLKTNSPISEEDVRAEKCGKVLGKNDKRVKPGHYVVEFNHHIQHGNPDGSYFENTPGFLNKNLHPKGLCMPCCFKKEWDSKFQVDRRKECTEAEKSKPAVKRTNAKQESYIYDIRRYPIPPERWGFLPISVQFFLQTDNSSSVNPNNNKYLRDDADTATLLRYGVENSSKKSFIGCIADIYASMHRMSNVPTISDMCDILADAISLDQFLKCHNGSLANIFHPKTYNMEDIDPTKYIESTFMTRLDDVDLPRDDNTDLTFFIYDTIASYENFIAFLKDPESFVDHTYLWDIVCSPNPAIFPKGCNLAILRIKEVDMTDDIELLCPTSVYSSVLYDLRKETVVLIKHDEFYEPVYLVKNKVDTNGISDTRVEKMFLEDASVIENIRVSLKVIRTSIQMSCMPKSSLPKGSSMPKTYEFSRPLPAESVRTILLKYQFEIRGQIVNYQGKTIGFWIKWFDEEMQEVCEIYIPCYPSAQFPETPIYFMDDDRLRISGKDTIKRLMRVNEITHGEIRSRPRVKIIEDILVVGVLTETNQFIMFSEPVENEDDGIPVMQDENYLIVDKEMAKNKLQDPLRTETVQMISLETQFYGAFRTTVRILLNQTKHKPYKKQIAEMIDSRQYRYRDKLRYITGWIHLMCDSHVTFKEFDKMSLMGFSEISDCFLNPGNKTFCIVKSGNNVLVLPKTHLLNGNDNRTFYFERMADELIRYKRIHMYMMNSTTYLNITNTEYKINEDEMLMLESLLTTDYFKSLEPYQHGNAVITFETANPVLTQKYANKISQKDQERMVNRDTMKDEIQDNMGFECIRTTGAVTGNDDRSFWKNFFQKDRSSESVLHKTIKCSFYPIIYVYYETRSAFLTVQQIKARLITEYAKYGYEYSKILRLLRLQGKRDLVDDVVKGKYTLEQAILSEVYFLTALDIWLLASSYNLPMILFRQGNLNLFDGFADETGVKIVTPWLRLSDADAPHYYFIRVYPEQPQPGNYLPQYSVIKPHVSSTSPKLLDLFSSATENSQMSISTYFEKQENRTKPVKGVVDAARYRRRGPPN